MNLYSNQDSSQSEGLMAEINTTPMVDVMLVLLIIFLLTIPAISASVHVNLPIDTSQRLDTSVEHVVVSVDKSGNLYLNKTYAPNIETLSSLIKNVAAQRPQPQIYIRADANAPYAYIGQVIDAAQSYGFARVSLMTEPLLISDTQATSR